MPPLLNVVYHKFNMMSSHVNTQGNDEQDCVGCGCASMHLGRCKTSAKHYTISMQSIVSKQAGIYWPKNFNVWVTLHPEVMDAYEAERKAKGFPGGYEIVSINDYRAGIGSTPARATSPATFQVFHKGVTSSPSSGIICGKGRDRGRISRCSCRHTDDRSAGHFLPEYRTIVTQICSRVSNGWNEILSLPAYEQYKPYLMRKSKKHERLTRIMFGEPTPEWLRGDPAPVNLAEAHA